MLVPLDHATIVNTTAIRSIAPAPTLVDGCPRSEVTFLDGSRKIVARSIADLDWCVGTIIPAPPGYNVVTVFPPNEPGGEMTFDTVPVLAFRLTADEPVPVTPFGKKPQEPWALVWPDGRCDEPWNRLWPSVEAFKAAFRGGRS